MRVINLILTIVSSRFFSLYALNICVAGGTGKFGATLGSILSDHDVTILARNAFLAAAPARVSSDFGWLGATYLQKNPHVRLRDWDGGDLLDIVGKDWIGWQDDVLRKADVVVNLVGGYTQQRVMATERIVRESLRVNPNALQITVSPRDDIELSILSYCNAQLKMGRVKTCEDMVRQNCINYECLRMEANKYDENCQQIVKLIQERCL